MERKIIQLERCIGPSIYFYKILEEREKAYFLEPCPIHNINKKKLWVPKVALKTKPSEWDDQSLRIEVVKPWFLKSLEQKNILNWI